MNRIGFWPFRAPSSAEKVRQTRNDPATESTMKMVMKRREALTLVGGVGALLAKGFVQEIPWRVIDSIRPSQNALKRVRGEVNGMLSGTASGTVVLVTKRGPMA